jgi:hypothetical protein
MDKLLEYPLIGIGEFSHGINESWEFRFKLLKFAMKNTSKKIIIFNEMSGWQAANIMNGTIWDRVQNKAVKYSGIRIEEPVKNGDYVGGKLWQYIGHASDSAIFLQIIRYIRKNIDRITIIGVDNDRIDRDFDMYKIIMSNYTDKNVNFFWAHNAHVSATELSSHNLAYIKNKAHKWFAGYYLKNKLGLDYCIVLSMAYRGVNRFNGYCSGSNCAKRTFQLEYFYHPFVFTKFKKYINKQKKYQLIPFNKFEDNNLPSFSNSYFRGVSYGIMDYLKTNNYNYILFWNSVNKLR